MTEALEEATVAKKLAISPDLKLPPDTVTATVIVYGGKGMGKTNFGSVLAEELAAAGLKFAWLDPPGVSWGLRHSADGKGPGIEVLILGGPHGDIPIEPTAGAVVADLVVDNDVNVVIDISRKPDGTMWSIADRVRFVTAYAKRLYQRQGEKRRPIMQVLDEAARFIPQVVRSGEAEVAACMGALAVLVEEGRNVGIGVTFITQRSARLNKDVAELADCMVAFRTVGPNSRRAVMDWLGEHVEKERLRELDEAVRKLPVGSALVVSPGWLEFEGVVKMRARETFDSSATPKAGETRKASGPGAKPDLAKYQELMAETIERAKAEDPRELRKRIAELERKLAAAAKERPALTPAVKEKRVEVPIFKDGQIGKLERAAESARKASETLATAATMVAAIAAEKMPAAPPAQTARAPVRAPPPPGPAPAPRARRETAVRADAGGPLGKGELRILTAAAQHPDGVTREQLTVLTGYTRSSRNTYIQRLRAGGLVVDGARVIVTQAGLDVLGPNFEPLPTGAALLEHWRHELPQGERAILERVVEAYPSAIDKEQLSELTEYTRSSRNTYIQRLRARELITEPGGGVVRASDTLFLGGA